MASTSHSGQIRNSHSPSVIALSSAKAPSTAAAKPRFRSRTGCWTCRKRKVKCDERGRNPETVAYAGMLSTSSGCKRCEDSGRPCHGYGAQPPSGPLITHYPSSNLHQDSSLRGTQFYSFSSYSNTQDNVNMPATFPVVMSNTEPDPRYIPHSMQWAQPFEQSLPENQALSYGLRMLRNTPSCSSPAPASLGVPPINQTSVPFPSVDLRRFSVPNYPTWRRSPQLRNNGHSYSPGGLPGNAFSLDQPSSTYDNVEEAIPPTNVASVYERPESILQVGECNALSADTYQNAAQSDISPIYNHDVSESDAHSLSFDFTRPHTSSGITLSYDDSQSVQSLPKVYGSPIHGNSKELECIEESSGSASTPLPTCTEASIQAWPEHANSSVSIEAFRSLSSALNNHPLNPVQSSLFSAHAQVNDSLKCQPSESFKKTNPTDIPLFPSMRDIPYDVHAVHPTHHPTSCSTACQEDSVSNHFYRPCVPTQRLSRRNPSLTTVDLCSQSGHPDRWVPHGLIQSLENHPYEYKPVLDQKGNEFHGIDAHEDDSPTSTAPSNTSGAPGAT